MNFANFTGVGAAAAVVAALWTKIQAWAAGIWNLVFCEIELHGDAASALIAYFGDCAKRISLSTRTYGGQLIVNRQSTKRIGFEYIANKSALYMLERKFVVVSRVGNTGEADLVWSSYIPMKMTFLRWTLDHEDILRKALEYYHKKSSSNLNVKSKRFAVEKIFGKGADLPTFSRSKERTERSSSGQGSAEEKACLRWLGTGQCRLVTHTMTELATSDNMLDSLALPEEVIAIVEEAKMWLQNKDWFVEKQIPWSLGWLLEGKPGGGKTTLSIAIAQELDLPVFVIDLASMDNHELNDAWDRAKERSPAMILLEDYDRVFEGSRNIAHKLGGGLTLDALLNCMSGASSSFGLFTILTCNDLSKVDKAIAQVESDGKTTRPGRIDRVISLGNLDEECRRKIAIRTLSDIIPSEELETLVKENKDVTAAQFTDICVKIALRKFWKK